MSLVQVHIFFVLCFVFTIHCVAAPVGFAGDSVDGFTIAKEKVWNPKPLYEDIALPMPCGMNMVIRPVAVAGSLVTDRGFFMGVKDPGERQIFEKAHRAYIAAPFTWDDVRLWHAYMATPEGDGYTYYFIGKYEVSQGQWKLFMEENYVEGECPKVFSPSDALPKSDISWFEVQTFLRRYNEWLIKEKVTMPKIGKDAREGRAFFRLPTEEEWEYAARGGHKVEAPAMNNNDCFPLDNGKTLDNYGVYGHEAERALPIGSRQPNRLGIFDTVGNIAELVEGLFRPIVPVEERGLLQHRRYGSAGGLVCKGGSYLSRTDLHVLPGARNEWAIYNEQGVNKAPHVGFRVALGGINFVEGRIGMWRQQVHPIKRKDEPKGAEDPIVALEKLENLKAVVLRLRRESLLDDFRAQLYHLESLHNVAYRLYHADKELNDAKEGSKEYKKCEKKVSALLNMIDRTIDYYKMNLNKIFEREGTEDYTTMLGNLRQEYSENDLFDKHMRENIAAIERHVRMHRNNSWLGLTHIQLIDSSLRDENYRKLIAKYYRANR